MSRFRKRPVDVDAVSVAELLKPSGQLPAWTEQAFITDGRLRIDDGLLSVRTNQDVWVAAKEGEWILRASDDDLWPIAGDLFAENYDPVSSAPPAEAWQGEPPAEGTRRRVIVDALKGWILANPGKPITSDEEALEFADSIEIALQSAEAQPEGPAHEPSVPVLYTAREQLQSVSDVDRGRLLELVGGATSVVGALVRHAAEQLEGFPPDVAAAALLLTALGIADQAGDGPPHAVDPFLHGGHGGI